MPRQGVPKPGPKGFVSLLVSLGLQVVEIPRLNLRFEPCTATLCDRII